jgi:membrane protein
MGWFKTKQKGLRARRQQLDALNRNDTPLKDTDARFGQKLLVFARRVLKTYTDAGVSSRAASVTYYTFLSLFPLLITVGNLLPVFGLNYHVVEQYIGQLIPASILQWLNPVIENLLTSTSGGVLSIGAVATLWAATVGINELKTSYQQIYRVERKANFLVGRVLGMLVILLVVAALATVMIAFTFGTQLLEWLVPKLGLSIGWITTFNTLRWPVALVALLVALLIINYSLSGAHIRLRTVVPGSIFTVVTWMLVAQLFALYMRFFGTRYSSYGTLGSFMVLLLWLNLSAMLLLLGAVINAEVSRYSAGELRARSTLKQRMRRRRQKG